MRLRTANHHRTKVLRRAVYEAAFAYHLERALKVPHHKLIQSGYIRRAKKRQKALRRVGS